MSDISYEVDNDGVAVVTWDLKDRTMNVLNFNSLGCLLYTSDAADE